ncbi:MAG: HAD family hydrolase [Pseudomonadota bacterium]
MSTTHPIEAVFFDLGATLVEPQFDPSGALRSYTVMPGAAAVLKSLYDARIPLGIISNTGSQEPQTVLSALHRVELDSYFDTKLVLLSGQVKLDKSTPAIFRLAAATAGITDLARCLFVGDDPDERRNARLAGFQTRKTPAAVPGLIKAPALNKLAPNITGMAACIADVRQAFADPDQGPPDILDFNKLLLALTAAAPGLPALYREHFAEPFIARLNELGPTEFVAVLQRDPSHEREAGLLLDICQAIFQHGSASKNAASRAFQEVVSDLYDGLFGAATRTGVKLPDITAPAPLVKWGNPQSGPYTWPINSTSIYGAGAAVVNMPPANARLGLCAWPALPHETAGHDFLHADAGLQEEVAGNVYSALRNAKIGAGLPDYWAKRIDETASDVLGILNMGPAAAIGLVAYFKGMNDYYGHGPTLRNEGPADDPHPADILRGFLAAKTVSLLSFDGAAAWAELLEQQTHKEVSTIVIGGVAISEERAKLSCEIVAKAICATRLQSLNNHMLLDIQNWRNQDEDAVALLRAALVNNVNLPTLPGSGLYAAHAVAAASLSALAGDKDPQTLFARMLTVLNEMHDINASWGPLHIVHQGDVLRRPAFRRAEVI